MCLEGSVGMVERMPRFLDKYAGEVLTGTRLKDGGLLTPVTLTVNITGSDMAGCTPLSTATALNIALPATPSCQNPTQVKRSTREICIVAEQEIACAQCLEKQ
jgi:hypothetical protein